MSCVDVVQPPARTKSVKNTTETERLHGVRKNVQTLLRKGSEALLQQHPVRATREYLQALVVLKKLSSVSRRGSDDTIASDLFLYLLSSRLCRSCCQSVMFTMT